MATSEVEVGNLALVKIGAEPIIAFTDESKAAKALTRIFAVTRDDELRRRNWHFAKARVSLPALSAAPAFGYTYAYQLPTDCLRVRSVGEYSQADDRAPYRTGMDRALYAVEGREILTDLSAPLKVRYTRRVEDVALFDASFVDVLASRLAKEIALHITGLPSVQQAADTGYQQSVRQAVSANAIERPPEAYPEDGWLLERL